MNHISYIKEATKGVKCCQEPVFQKDSVYQHLQSNHLLSMSMTPITGHPKTMDIVCPNSKAKKHRNMEWLRCNWIALELYLLRLHQVFGTFVTLPDRMHRVHAFRNFGLPSTTARTLWMLGSHRRLVRLWACETLLPVIGPLPHISHRCAIIFVLLCPRKLGPALIPHACRRIK